MTARLLDFPCPICGESSEPCALCFAQADMDHDEARRAEELRLALAFAEFGYVPEVRLEGVCPSCGWKTSEGLPR